MRFTTDQLGKTVSVIVDGYTSVHWQTPEQSDKCELWIQRREMVHPELILTLERLGRGITVHGSSSSKILVNDQPFLNGLSLEQSVVLVVGSQAPFFVDVYSGEPISWLLMTDVTKEELDLWVNSTERNTDQIKIANMIFERKSPFHHATPVVQELFQIIRRISETQ